jgi:Fe-S-cluster containining protein
MARLEDGWCAALDRKTMLCTIYERRPAICRDFELGGYDCLAERFETRELSSGIASFSLRVPPRWRGQSRESPRRFNAVYQVVG